MATTVGAPESPTTRRKHIIIRDGDSLESLTQPKVHQTFSGWQSEMNHLPASEIWPIKYGPVICGVLGAATAFFVTYNLRKGLVLRELGSKSNYLFAAGISGLTTAGFHFASISAPLLEQGITECPVCLQVRGGMVQVATGGLYAATLGPLTLYPLIRRMKKSFRLPSITKSPMDVINYFKSLLQPVRRYAVPILIAQTVAGMGLTYLEQEAYISNVNLMISSKTNPDASQSLKSN